MKYSKMLSCSAVLFALVVACSSSERESDDDDGTGTSTATSAVSGAGGGAGGQGGGQILPTALQTLHLTSVASTPAPAGLVGFQGSWDQIDSQILGAGPMVLGAAPDGVIQSAKASEATLTTPWNVALAQFVSAPMAAQSVGGDMTWEINVDSSAPGAEYFTHVYLAVWTEAEHCVLAEWTETSTDNEWGLFPDGHPAQPVPLQPCDVPDGGRLVLEFGYTSKNTHNVSREGTMSFGGETSPSVTFSQEILFQ